MASSVAHDLAPLEKGSGVALFDFDGTISNRDSLPLFLCHAASRQRYLLEIVRQAPTLAAYKLKLLSNHRAKERFLGSFFHGWERDRLLGAGESFCREQLGHFIRPAAMRRIREHEDRGHRVVVVTASLEEWLAPWCSAQGLEIAGTRLEYDASGRATGRFATPNCHGAEKVRRVMDLLGARPGVPIHAYGDSRGDREMLAWADHGWYRPF